MKQLSRKIIDAPVYPERIIQIGGGNFLRAFVDWMVQRLNRDAGFNSSVVVCQSAAGPTLKKLVRQDGLYTVCLSGLQEGRPVRQCELVSCISRILAIGDEFEAFLKLAEQPAMRFIISDTTEAGIVHYEDESFERPRTYPGRLTALLYRRYQSCGGADAPGFIILPCEPARRNGDTLRMSVFHYALDWDLDDDFTDWLDDANIFCNTLLDRAVPGFPAERAEALFHELGYRDELLVECETYHLWVIEGPDEVRRDLPAERAGLNVKVVANLENYRDMKVRILNGTHTAMLPIGLLLGLGSVQQTVEHELAGRFVREVLEEEILPALNMEGSGRFGAEIMERFRNPYIEHRLESVAENAFKNWPNHLLKSIELYVDSRQALPVRLSFALASLVVIYMDPPFRLQDDPLILNIFKGPDPLPQLFSQLGLNRIEGLQQLVALNVKQIRTHGLQRALSAMLASALPAR